MQYVRNPGSKVKSEMHIQVSSVLSYHEIEFRKAVALVPSQGMHRLVVVAARAKTFLSFPHRTRLRMEQEFSRRI